MGRLGIRNSEHVLIPSASWEVPSQPMARNTCRPGIHILAGHVFRVIGYHGPRAGPGGPGRVPRADIAGRRRRRSQGLSESNRAYPSLSESIRVYPRDSCRDPCPPPSPPPRRLGEDCSMSESLRPTRRGQACLVPVERANPPPARPGAARPAPRPPPGSSPSLREPNRREPSRTFANAREPSRTIAHRREPPRTAAAALTARPARQGQAGAPRRAKMNPGP